LSQAAKQKQKDPARAGTPGEAFVVRAPLQHSGHSMQAKRSARRRTLSRLPGLVDHLNDAARARLD
jgi:hypothetical protein